MAKKDKKDKNSPGFSRDQTKILQEINAAVNKIANAVDATNDKINDTTDALSKLAAASHKYFNFIEQGFKKLIASVEALGENIINLIPGFNNIYALGKTVFSGLLQSFKGLISLNPFKILSGLASAAFAVIHKVIETVIGDLQKISDSTFDAQASFALGAKQAASFGSFAAIAQKSLQSMGITASDLVQSGASMAQTFGDSALASQKLAVETAKIAKAAGIGNSEVATMYLSFQAMKGSSFSAAQNTFKLAVSVAKANNIPINKLMKDISASSEFAAKYGGKFASNLITAAAMAAKLGINLSTVQKSIDGILNIEESVNAQFEASVLLGREVNLEQARHYAILGKSDLAMGEILKQVGSEAELLNLLPLQREALAKAIGVSADELGRMVGNQKKGEEVQDKTQVLMEKQNKSIKDMSGLLSPVVTTMGALAAATERFFMALAQAFLGEDYTKVASDGLSGIIKLIDNLTLSAKSSDGELNKMMKELRSIWDNLLIQYEKFKLWKTEFQEWKKEHQNIIDAIWNWKWAILGVYAALKLLITSSKFFMKEEATSSAIKTLFTGIGKGIGGLAKGLGKSIEYVFVGIGKGLDGLGKGLGKSIEYVFEGLGKGLDGLGKGLGKSIEYVFVGIGKGIEGLAKGLGKSIEYVFVGIGKGIEGLAKGIGKSIEYVFEGLGKGIEGLAKGIGKGINHALSGLAKGLEKMGSTKSLLGTVAMVIIAGAIWILSKALENFNNISWKTLAIAGVAIGGLMLAIIGLGAIMMSGLGTAAIFLGILALAALGVALIPLAYALKLAGPGLESFGKMIESFGKVILDVVNNVLSYVGPIIKEIGDAITNILSTIKPMIDAAGDAISKIIGSMKDFVVSVLEKISNISGEKLSEVGVGLGAIALGLGALTASSIVTGLVSLFTQDPVTKIRNLISSVNTVNIEKINQFKGMVDFLKTANSKNISDLGNSFEALGTGINAMGGNVILGFFKSDPSTKISNLLKAFSGIDDNKLKSIKNLAELLASFSKDSSPIAKTTDEMMKFGNFTLNVFTKIVSEVRLLNTLLTQTSTNLGSIEFARVMGNILGVSPAMKEVGKESPNINNYNKESLNYLKIIAAASVATAESLAKDTKGKYVDLKKDNISSYLNDFEII